ncbi:MAG: hypothetical protein IPO21_13110 [Bacteroidales bacterium]|nr:hypothetical protein [Bacteroidales bacterium]
MIFQNKKHAAKNKFTRLIIMVLFAASIVIVTFIDSLNTIADGYGKHVLIGLLAVIYIVYNIIRNAKKLYFIYFADINGKLLFRFYHIRMFAKNCRAIEIPQHEFYSYEIKKNGFVKYLYLKQLKSNKPVAFPPISVNSLNDSELFAITSSLDKFKSV